MKKYFAHKDIHALVRESNPPARNAGNIFFALFAALAMVGAVGYGFNSVLRGPMSTMTEVTRKTLAENTVITTSRLAIVNATQQKDTLTNADISDCDSDGSIEPLPYTDAGGAESPVGGGYLPTGLVPDDKDPWNTRYGYCAWDVGSISVSDAVAACGGATPGRLQGGSDQKQYVIALISAGKDRKFQTSCTAFNALTPNASLITRTPGSDDIVLAYSYREANDLGAGLWKPKANDSGTAVTPKGLEVKQGGTIAGGVVLTGNSLTGGGLRLPGDPGDNSLTGACATVNDKQIRRNTGTNPPTIEICDQSLGWTPLSGVGTSSESGGGNASLTGTLVSYWQMDETGGTSASDSSGNNNGTLVNAPAWTTGYLGNALQFTSASSQYVSVERSASLEPTAVTVVAWVKRTGSPATSTTIVAKSCSSGCSPNYSYALTLEKSGTSYYPTFGIGTASATSTLSGTSSAGDGQWVHVVGVYSPSATAPQQKIYINGQLADSKTLTDAIAYSKTVNDKVFIGSGGTGGPYMSGMIDDVRIYNYAMSAADINDLYNEARPSDVSLSRPKRPAQAMAWGIDDDERTGNGPIYQEHDGLQPVVSAYDFVQVSAGTKHACGVRAGGTVWCWGDQTDGKLGNGETTAASISVPVQVQELSNVSKVSASANRTCAIKRNGHAYCWGNGSGGLGGGSATTSATPIEVSTYTDFVDIATGVNFACGVRQSGEAACWGTGSKGVIGNGSTANQSTPAIVSDITDFVSITASRNAGNQACGITKTGEAYCWGEGVDGSLGNDTATGQENSPVAVYDDDEPNFVDIDTNGNKGCAVRGTGTIWCWGNGDDGQIGNGGTSDQVRPTQVSNITDFVKVSVGNTHACGLRKGGEIWCWGSNTSGQLGKGDHTGTSSIPVRAYGFGYVDVSAGDSFTTALADVREENLSSANIAPVKLASAEKHACMVRKDGTAWCWGEDGSGQLGNGAVSGSQQQPSPVSDAGPWLDISTGFGSTSTCGLKTDGSVWCWGSDSNGQLGAGGAGDQTSPVAVDVADDELMWTKVSVGTDHACGIRTDGTAWCWGSNSNGKLGTGGGSVSSPAEVSGDDLWIDISAGPDTSCGIKKDGTAWCWGSDSNGQLGNGAVLNTSQNTPSQVDDPGPWAKISAGKATCGLKNDGSVWCWGKDENGLIGNGSDITEDQTSPVRAFTNAPFMSIAAGVEHNCGTDIYGGAWCWGAGNNGRIGNGLNVAAQEIPVRVTGAQKFMTAQPGINASCATDVNENVWCWGTDTNGRLGNGSSFGSTTLPSKVLDTPTRSAWYANETSTGLSALWNLNPIIGTTRYISGDGTSTGLRLRSDGASITQSTANQLLLDARGTSYASQIRLNVASATASGDVTSGLVHRWKMDETYGTFVDDSVGTTDGGWAWSGVLTPATGVDNGALSFNGSSGFVLVTYNASLYLPLYTVSFWAKGYTAPTTGSVTSKMFDRNENFSVNWSHQWGYPITCEQNDGSGRVTSPVMPINMVANQWYFIVCSYDGTTLRMYIDGNQVSSVAAGTPVSAASNMGIGAGSNGSSPFNGAMDDVRMYNRALSASEIQQVYENTSQLYANRSVGLDYNTGSFEISRTTNNPDALVTSLQPDLEIGSTGNVGIRTKGAPATKLDVNGAIKIGNDGGGCTSGKVGTIQWTGSAWQYCRSGGSWRPWGTMTTTSVLMNTNSQANIAGVNGSCAVMSDGYAKCWGRAADGELGNGTTTPDATKAVTVHTSTGTPGWSDWKQVGSGGNHACGLRADGTTWCWGLGTNSQLGNNGSASSSRPVRVQNSDGSGAGYWSDWKQLSIARYYSCGLRSNGTLWCWGTDTNGSMGNGTTSSVNARPVQVKNSSGAGTWSDWTSVYGYYQQTCGIRTDGSAWCWGNGSNGQLGNGTTATTNNPLPIQVKNSGGGGNWTDWRMITAGAGMSCGIRADGTAWCWGGINNWGSRGDGLTTNNVSLPVQVKDSGGGSAYSDWLSLSAGGGQVCGIRANGSAYCWGLNANGQVGDSTSGTNRSLPVQVYDSAGTGYWYDWVQVIAGNSHTCGIRSSGTTWCWGNNSNGRLGNNSTSQSTIPVQVQFQ
ncbi:MAG: hypothetical protein DI551_00155 [Micavibrio aeruginosavorus]|uniref:LamG-like jellyroll fold domain-containing protein n=1 Tax=Micavibrio aeruginosavorus TaxID=349221 RepID=A0A2W5QCE4_9BACT|nr:MAG: hypothetical protein DI551_00155 [Micavibrio aeruginosavorus]